MGYAKDTKDKIEDVECHGRRTGLYSRKSNGNLECCKTWGIAAVGWTPALG